MKFLAILAIACCIGLIAHAQDKGAVDTRAQERAEMEAKAMAMAQPGPEHNILEQLAGTWNVSMSYWMAPAQPAVSADFQQTSKMILGGRFLQTNTDSDFMGHKFASIGLMGFDRRHNVFTTYGCDTWGTYCVSASGPMEGNVITMYGEDDDPVLGHTQKYNMICTIIDKDTFKWEIIFIDMHPGVKEFKMIEMIAKRAK